MKKNWLVLGMLLCIFSLNAGEYRWVNGTYTWKGVNQLSTENVKLVGTQFRVRYAVPKESPLKVNMTIPSDNNKSVKLFNHFHSRTMTNSRTFTNRPGAMVHFDIAGSENGWELAVDQYMDTVTEWNFRQTIRKNREKEEKVGLWQQKGEDEFEIDAPAAPWKLVLNSKNGKKVKITVADENDNCYMKQTASAGKNASSWFHYSGKFIVKVSGEASSAWSVVTTQSTDAVSRPLPVVETEADKPAEDAKPAEEPKAAKPAKAPVAIVIVAPAAKPAAKPAAAKPAAKPAVAPAAKPAAAPAAKPAAAPAAKPAAVPAAKPAAAPAAKPAAAPAAKPAAVAPAK